MSKNKILNFVNSILISLLLIVCIFLNYKLYIENFENFRFYIKYFIIIIFLILLLLINFYFSIKLKEIILIFICSIFFSFYIFELFLLLSKKEILSNKEKDNKIVLQRILRADIQNIFYDKIKKKNVYQDLREKSPNKNISISIGTSNHLDEKNLFPLANSSNSLILHCNENGFWSTYNSDRYGFNNNDKIWEANKIDILITGDSFIEGACVDTRKDGIATNLKNLSKKNIMNLGIGASGILSHYARIIEYSASYRFEKILFFITEKDFEKDYFKEKNSKLSKYLTSGWKQNLKIKQNQINSLLKEKIEFSFKEQNTENKNLNYDLVDFIKLYKLRFFFIRDKFNFNFKKKDEMKNLEKIFLNIKELHPDSELIVIFLPRYENYDGYFKKKQIKEFENIKFLLKKLNISYNDLHQEIFLNEEEPKKNFPFELPGHYNAIGYSKISNYINEKILNAQ